LIREIEIEGFKSIERLKLELGQVTVLIGENGCGKSNILEAIAFASAAYAVRLDHEFLAPRGIRSTEPRLMRPAFAEIAPRLMRMAIRGDGDQSVVLHMIADESSSVPRWEAIFGDLDSARIDLFVQEANLRLRHGSRGRAETGLRIPREHEEQFDERPLPELSRFLVFSPENTALRAFQKEGQILPIGINGEGLFSHLRALKQVGNAEILEELNRRLSLIDWFSGFEIPSDLGPGEHRLSICDRHLPSDVLLDQRSANEGFLFLLFYYTLLLSPDAPTFFAIDNIDASLNPRLCARLMKEVVELAKMQDKQVVVTTHNPAVLDGLNLADDDQRLVVVSRTQRGTTRVGRIPAPRPIQGAPLQCLSEAFIRGFLGGLPDNF